MGRKQQGGGGKGVAKGGKLGVHLSRNCRVGGAGPYTLPSGNSGALGRYKAKGRDRMARTERANGSVG